MIQRIETAPDTWGQSGSDSAKTLLHQGKIVRVVNGLCREPAKFVNGK